MNSLKLALSAFSIAMLAAACQGINPALTTPAPIAKPKLNYAVAQATAEGLSYEFDSRIDILMVIDDSESMRSHQVNMSKNINSFIDALAKIKAIDFHIAYTHVHDRIRYTPLDVPSVCGAETTTPGRLNWEEPGTIKTFVGPAADKLTKDGRRFLTRDDDYKTILKATLDPVANPLMIKKYIGKDPKHPSICPQGPENEESFTPILGSLENPMLARGPNKDFRRPGAFFVAMIFSDAKDESVNYDNMSPTVFARRLSTDTGEAQAGKKRFRVFSVVISPGTWIGNSKDPKSKNPKVCLPDPAFADSSYQTSDGHTHYRWHDRQVEEGENPLVEAARLTEDPNSDKDSQVLSICSENYGETLAHYGLQLQHDALSDVILTLPHHPQHLERNDPEYATKSLKVLIGNVPLTEGSEWDYNPQNGGSVIVYGQKIDWNRYPNAKIRVSYTPVDETSNNTKIVH